MSMRASIIGLLVLVAVCGGGLFFFTSYMSRDAQMRDSERDFRIAHSERIAKTIAAADRTRYADDDSEWVEDGGDIAAPEELDDWYADSSASGPFDPTPEEDDFLIADTEPYSDAQPIDW